MVRLFPLPPPKTHTHPEAFFEVVQNGITRERSHHAHVLRAAVFYFLEEDLRVTILGTPECARGVDFLPRNLSSIILITHDDRVTAL